MKITINKILFIILIVGAIGCKTNEKIAQIELDNEQNTTSTKNVILKTPLNSMDEKSKILAEADNYKYYLLQLANHRFKDNSPFIEFMDNGSRECLWFTSSRPDEGYTSSSVTNLYQQIYYSERTIDEGKFPREGWMEPVLFKVETKHPALKEYYRLFNKANKGTVAIANDVMICSCQHFEDTIATDFRDLWELKKVDSSFTDPLLLSELSDPLTWESQPTLSQNGNHIFYISNRKVLANNQVVKNVTANQYHLYYSFKTNEKWSEPELVQDLNLKGNVLTPSLKFDDSKLLFSYSEDGNYDLYEVEIELNNEEGGFQIKMNSLCKFSDKLIDLSESKPENVKINDGFNQQYPFYYSNAANKKAPRAIYWASNDSTGYGSFDIYGCTIPYVINYKVELVDVYSTENFNSVMNPIITISGDTTLEFEEQKASVDFYSGLDYNIKGGSFANQDNGVYYCDVDDEYIFIGYSKIKGENPRNRFIHDNPINGAVIPSVLSNANMSKLFYSASDTTIFDTIYVTKAWKKKPFCPGKLNIEPKHKSIAYFQTGYWEVNTTANLKRDLAIMHEGFKVLPDNDCYNPQTGIERLRSDYRAFDWEAPLFPIKPNDKYNYSIANARWIELHPNNLYWGDRPGFGYSIEKRMEGRKNRIQQYITYAQKVDENLQALVDTIQFKYIDLLLKHKKHQPKLLIEIFAVSDQREVLRGWYIGDTVQYRGSDYDEFTETFTTENVKIIPPKVNEKTKVLDEIVSCSIKLNEDGNNGSKLGLSLKETNQNTNLSRLRAWYGYKEVYKRLAESERFQSYLKDGKVALPDNNVPYQDAEIVIITRGIRKDDNIRNPQNAYPAANNPSGNGYFDFDKIRRIEIQTRLLFDENTEVEKDYCCDPREN